MSELTPAGQQKFQELQERANQPGEELFRNLSNLLTDVYSKEQPKDENNKVYALNKANKILGYYDRFVSEEERKNSKSDLRGIIFRTSLALGEVDKKITQGELHEETLGLKRVQIQVSLKGINEALSLIDKYYPSSIDSL